MRIIFFESQRKITIFLLIALIGGMVFASGSLSARQTSSNQIEVTFSSNYRDVSIYHRKQGDRNWQITNLNYGNGTLRINNVQPGTYEIKAHGGGGTRLGFQNGMRIGGDVIITVSAQTTKSSSKNSSPANNHVDVHCVPCHGSGKCPKCNGKGTYYKDGVNHGKYKCNRCDGNGKCIYCRGTGRK